MNSPDPDKISPGGRESAYHNLARRSRSTIGSHYSHTYLGPLYIPLSESFEHFPRLKPAEMPLLPLTPFGSFGITSEKCNSQTFYRGDNFPCERVSFGGGWVDRISSLEISRLAAWESFRHRFVHAAYCSIVGVYQLRIRF